MVDILKRFARYLLADELQIRDDKIQRQDEAITVLSHALLHVHEVEAQREKLRIFRGRKSFAELQGDWEWQHNKKAREAAEKHKMGYL